MFRRFLIFCGMFFVAASASAQPQDASELVIRNSEMEQQIRQMVGQIEQLQHENRKLKEQLRSLGVQITGDGSTNTSPGPTAKIIKLDDNKNSPPSSSASPKIDNGRAESLAPRRDVFDPAEQPNAPGIPKPLGSTTASPPLSGAELPQGQTETNPSSETLSNGKPEEKQANAVASAPPSAAPVGPSIAATGSDNPRSDYEDAYFHFTKGSYREAEMGFRKFLQSHPRDALVPDAIYWLGETYLLTNRPREAGEQFLNLTRQYASSSKAPGALFKLGTSLANLGAADRACAIFAETIRKYPKASQNFKDEVSREQRRVKCS